MCTKVRKGVALLIKSGIVSNEVKLDMVPAHTTYESVFVNVIQSKGPDIHVGSLYRSPGQSPLDFNEELQLKLRL